MPNTRFSDSEASVLMEERATNLSATTASSVVQTFLFFAHGAE